MQIPAHRPRPQHGFTLIEILVAVIVLSIGLLGVASLQLASKRGNYEAMQRVAATMYAEDLVERMRTNPGNLDTYAAPGSTLTLTAAPTFTDPDCTSVECSGLELAQHDLHRWWEMVTGQSEAGSGGLVSPTACIYNPTAGVSEYIVAIAWRGLDEIVDVASAVGPTALGTARDCGRSVSAGGLYEMSTSLDRSYRRIITLYTYIDPSAG